jgi:very-short-patch-repair endonuclease
MLAKAFKSTWRPDAIEYPDSVARWHLCHDDGVLLCGVQVQYGRYEIADNPPDGYTLCSKCAAIRDGKRKVPEKKRDLSLARHAQPDEAICDVIFRGPASVIAYWAAFLPSANDCFSDYMEDLKKKCESPIEKEMFMAMCGGIRALEAVRGKHCPEFRIVPQLRIGDYRVDFAVYAEMDGTIARISVECDGHDYHSSREDRARDSKRDRELRRSGWQPVRFTGNEIRKRPGDCAWEVLNTLMEELGLAIAMKEEQT